ncbi:hypothetical protein [uncultured Vibrio sp.]|uniref:hypothetical protein n=1 Tax=Vibrio sp. TaxID=678 RepID=UPI0029C96D88|nr:hypothetical protein [uncultured Vibrio sp.]
MKRNTLTIAIAALLSASAAQAGGPLFTTDDGNPTPYVWDTSNGSIPVYVDGGEAFTYDYDGTTPFLTIDRAKQITQFAFAQWNNVETSTFSADIENLIAIESKTGIADVDGSNALQFYTQQNGYGFWVLYDTDGSILENLFGVSKESVLGISFPEIVDGNNKIIEATTVINGWNVWDTDNAGLKIAGVFTHEIGHALNLSHSQTNGHMGYSSNPSTPYFPGVAGCDVEAVHAHDTGNWYLGEVNRADPEIIETMYPFIGHHGAGAVAQSTVNVTDDRTAISNLYPTEAYLSQFGSIEGTLRLKDGSTEYSGVNIIARNIDDPLFDAVSAQSGNLTQGKVGPDGYFKLNGLTPGASYVLYTEAITSGSYPTDITEIVSVAEYWNDNEGNNPVSDDPCDVTAIVAEAGQTKQADLVFNGYRDGVDFKPIVYAHLTDLAKDGKSAIGMLGSTPFVWDEKSGINTLPDYLTTGSASMSANGKKLLLNSDHDRNGVTAPAIWTDNKGVLPLGDLTGNVCGGSSEQGKSAAVGWDIDAKGTTAVGTAYKDVDGNGSCTTYFAGEIVPFIWTEKEGMRELDTSNVDWSATPWTRAHAISGNGEVVMGSLGGNKGVAWVNEGEMINLYEAAGALGAYASSHDGKQVALQTNKGNVLIWDHSKEGDAAFTDIGSLEWCNDVPLVMLGSNFCESRGIDWVHAAVGKYVSLMPADMSDNGDVIIGRAGDVRTGYVGAIYIKGLGWMKLDDFFEKQGVLEAQNTYMDNPTSLDSDGSRMAGGVTGYSVSFLIDMADVYVCDNGASVKTSFPNGLIKKVKSGAEFGRCEHLTD